ncbi:MAG: mevalonate kinase [Chloroflexi bacterium]|nr:mevalonate kinase [Chloroflexota bacterium]
MRLGSGQAPGKVILFGEHAVVYGRPGLAAPVTQVCAEAIVEAAPSGAGVIIVAPDLGEEISLRDAAADHPLAAAARLALATAPGLALTVIRSQESGVRGQGSASFQLPVFDLQPLPDWRITIRSTIPIASGLGSGAAVSTALVRAIIDAAHQQIRTTQYALRNTHYAIRDTQALSALIYEVEKLHHGAPSGIDNTVIAYGQPVYFVRGQPPQPFAIGRPFTLAIADTGIRSPTKIAVEQVRRAWEAAPARFEALFDEIAAVVEAARTAIAGGQPDRLGPLMGANHALLQQIGVSSPELDALAAAARGAGALGAKLSGAGRGGNMIALITADTASAVTAALWAAHATNVIVTQVG